MTHKIYCLAIVILMCFTAQSHKSYSNECVATIYIQDIYSYLDSLLAIAAKNKSIQPENSDCLQMLYYLGWYNDDYFHHDNTKPHILTAEGLRDAYNWVKKHERQLTRTRIYHFLKIWQDMVSEQAIFNDEYFDSLLVELSRLRIIDEPQDFEFRAGIVNGVFLMSVLFMMSVAALVINHVSLAKKFGHLTMLLSEAMIGLSLYAIIYFI